MFEYWTLASLAELCKVSVGPNPHWKKVRWLQKLTFMFVSSTWVEKNRGPLFHYKNPCALNTELDTCWRDQMSEDKWLQESSGYFGWLSRDPTHHAREGSGPVTQGSKAHWTDRKEAENRHHVGLVSEVLVLPNTPQSSKTSPPAGDQLFKHMSRLGAFYIQTVTCLPHLKTVCVYLCINLKV